MCIYKYIYIRILYRILSVDIDGKFHKENEVQEEK